MEALSNQDPDRGRRQRVGWGVEKLIASGAKAAGRIRSVSDGSAWGWGVEKFDRVWR